MSALSIRLGVFVSTVIATLLGRLSDRRDRGATAVEYGLLVGLVAVAIIAAVTVLGTEIRDLFQGIATRLGNIPA